jgi:ABC-type proline/glycine betaine transport system permease subunit
MLPAIAAEQLLLGAETLFVEGTQISNPRILTSGGMALALLGGYIVLFGGLIDLKDEGASWVQRIIASAGAIVFIIIILMNGSLDIYSILVEYSVRGNTLGERFLEHIVFVIVALVAGLILGISLGLWASRDEGAETVILYTVGIIQTIPSLALFGVLLVPLARLGDQSFTSVFQFWIIWTIVAILVVFLLRMFMGQLPDLIRPIALIGTFVLVLVPAGLFIIMLITFGFKAVLNVFKAKDMQGILQLVGVGIIVIPFLVWLDRQIDKTHSIKWILYLRNGVAVLMGLAILYLLYQGGSETLAGMSLDRLTIRDFGVSGIGTAPAIIALTLYSLLPLVRNTYAGLKNVDPAIIDAGRGMGMTPGQIFFGIELPLAFPVIMAGVRNAAISLVGIAAVASIIGAGALGDFILLGINSTSIDLILLGALPAIFLAVLLDILLQVIQGLMTSPGLRS